MKAHVVFALIGALLATAWSAEEPRKRADDAGPPPPNTNPQAPVEQEYEKLLDMDDAAQGEVDGWIREHRDFASKGAASDDAALNKRIRERFVSVKEGYEEFLSKHPEHIRARVAYASFLSDVESEAFAQKQLEIALRYETNYAPIYNNLANIHGHTGDLKKAFEFYSKAIQLNPAEPVYYHNFGTTVYLFRKDAREYWGIDEQQVFDKAFGLYSNALRLDPTNFPLASDVAQTYYGVKPLRVTAALNAWTNALKLAQDDIEREGVYIHFARVKMLDGKFDTAREYLKPVTNSMYAELKGRVLRSIEDREQEAKGTNSPTSTAGASATPAAAISK